MSNITTLKDTTWYVPSGWTNSGYNQFYINGTVNGNNFNQFNYQGNAVWFTNYSTDDTYSYSNSSAFTFTVTGGVDVTNSSLIQWLVDNNATFEKEGEEETPTDHGEIHYNGSLLATIKAGQTVILHTKGFQAETDIVIKNVGGVKLISFTIDGETCYAEEGMTWAGWVKTGYNTLGISINLDDCVYLGLQQVIYNGGSVFGVNTIIANGEYSIQIGGGSN